MTEKEQFEKSFQRPRNYFKLSDKRKWEIDEQLGLLDWEGDNLSKKELKRFHAHYEE